MYVAYRYAGSGWPDYINNVTPMNMVGLSSTSIQSIVDFLLSKPDVVEVRREYRNTGSMLIIEVSQTVFDNPVKITYVIAWTTVV